MIVFITEQPYSFNLNGAASLSSSHLRMLRFRFPDEQLQVVLLSETKQFWAEEPDFPKDMVSVSTVSMPYITYRPLSLSAFFLAYFQSDYKKLIRSVFLIDSSRIEALSRLNTALSGMEKPSFIWCEHLMPLLYLHLLPDFRAEQVNLIYSHHDFLYKVMLVRKKSLKNYLRAALLKKIEHRALNTVRTSLSGSLSEVREIQKHLPENRKAGFLPCFFPPQTFGEISADHQLSIYHLGTSAATANRKGLEFFFQKVYPALQDLPVNIELFGEVRNYILSRFPGIDKNPRLIFHEFVPDLSQQMKPGMIHILPYAGFTGTRTRIPALTRFSPCLVGFENMKDSYPFLTTGENAMVARDEKEFTEFLLKLLSDQSLRNTISGNVAADMKKFEEETSRAFHI
jgi:glycosyltransferase involved in cell wall biosynthesis